MSEPPEIAPPPPLWRVLLDEVVVRRPGRAVSAAVAFAAVLAVGGAAVLGAGIGRPSRPPIELDLPRADTAVPATGSGPAVVHVAGAVHQPGVYRVKDGARVGDALDAAGGALPDADLDQLNLAARVADGERIYVPRRGEAVTASVGDPAAGGVLDLNTATAEQLEALPGIGPSTAEAIVAWRRQHGRFRSVRQLLEVRGIGEAKLAALKDKVRV